MNKKLVVFDVDETLLAWSYLPFVRNGRLKTNVLVDIRPNAVEMLENVAELCDVALFTTGSDHYVKHVAKEYFKNIKFNFLYGSSKVQYHKNEKVKNLALFDGYDIDNIILVDDKPRNARLQPNNYIQVKRQKYYLDKNIFDRELYDIEKKVIEWINK